METAIESSVEADLVGFELRTDAEVVCWPGRYMDNRGRKMWETVTAILDELGENA